MGLELPEQERWMFMQRRELNAPVLVGVGAAFKFISGQVERIAAGMGDCGFEWPWRFV